MRAVVLFGRRGDNRWRMTRAIQLRILRNATAEAAGNIALSDINLSDPAFEKLGLPATLRETPLANGPGQPPKEEKKPATPAGETAEAKAAREATEAAAAEAQAQADLAARADAAGITVEEQLAADQAETERVTAKAAELGKTVEEIQALEAEEAAASAPPEMDDAQRGYVEALVAEKDQEILTANEAKAAAEAEAATLRAQLETNKRPPLAIMGVHPMMLANNAQEIEQLDNQLAAFEKWAVENWDGSTEVAARGDAPAVPAFPADQIRKRYQEVKEQRAKLVPAAKAALTARVQLAEATKTVYPQLFDSKRAESKVVDGMLSSYPELQAVIPNFHLVAGDAIFGETLRKVLADPKHKSHAQANQLLNAIPELKACITIPKPAAATSSATAGKRPLPVLKGKTSLGKAPRPGGGASRVPVSGKAKADVSSAQLSTLKAGGLSEREALTTMIQGANLPTLAQTKTNE